MFRRTYSTSPQRVRSGRTSKRSFRESAKHRDREHRRKERLSDASSPSIGSTLTSQIITLVVGPEQRIFAAHLEVLCASPFFAAACKGAFQESTTSQIVLPDEIPEVFSSVLEFLYKGDYYPRLLHDKKRGNWKLEDAELSSPQRTSDRDSTIFISDVITHAESAVLKDTVIYCVAEKFGLADLKRLALRKQGLHTGIEVGTLLSSARYAYANTPDSDSKLRAHYLALIIRCRASFKRSGTMQMEMERGGALWFDLFVAMCNHMDDIASISGKSR